MKMGLVIYKGTRDEVKKEYEAILEKVKNGFEEVDIEYTKKGFNIKCNSISFQVDKLYDDEFAIFQIIK